MGQSKDGQYFSQDQPPHPQFGVPLTSGHVPRVLSLRPIQQVHLRGFLGGHTAPGPALVARLMQRRGILQLTGEVKAAFQPCKDTVVRRSSHLVSRTSQALSCPEIQPSPHFLITTPCHLHSCHSGPVQVVGLDIFTNIDW